MFQRGVPEKLIKERTGHRSLEALRKYEHASEEQVAKVSHTLAGHGVSPKCSEVSCPATFVGTLSGCFSAASLNGCSFSN